MYKLTEEMITTRVDYLIKQKNEVNIPFNVLFKGRKGYTRLKLTEIKMLSSVLRLVELQPFKQVIKFIHSLFDAC